MGNSEWFDSVKRYTERLVSIRSVSPGAGEVQVAQEVLRLLQADNLGAVYTASGLDALEGDPYGRQNVYAFLRGRSTSTLVLLGHVDTVDTKDYGALEQWALAPARLSSLLGVLLSSAERKENLSDWLFGRGVGDMKSGLAVNIALMRRLAERSRAEPYPLSVLMLATPDEENESAGILQAVRFLLRLRETYGLNYLGVINTDYVTGLYEGDPHRYVYAGTIGKLLPSFLCIGRETHAGLPFGGLDVNLLVAELIRDICMNDELCDSVPGQIAAPPVTLHAEDFKRHYDVQLPYAAYFYVNVLTLTTTPAELLERLRGRAEAVMTRLLRRLDETERRWREAAGEAAGDPDRQRHARPRSGSVLTYAELYAEVARKLGADRLRAELTSEWKRWPATLDRRERSLHLAHRLWQLSGRAGPAVVLYYSPPYYPAVAPAPGPLQDAVSAVIAAHPEVQLELRPYFPYLSDMSYLRLDPDLDVAALKANMPAWQPENAPPLPGAYSLPFTEIQRLGLPVIDWGPFGRGAHQRNEAVHMPYTFETLPCLLYETIERLAAQVNGQ